MRLGLLLILFVGSVSAHEWVPTYPSFKPSFIDEVMVTEMTLFNKREDAFIYEIRVLDKAFEPVKFATSERLVRLEYLQRRKIDIYIHKRDLEQVMYLCSTSRILAEDRTRTVISSNVCSKVNEEE